ncbi:HRDC domain-containing protein [Bdellovibrio sp. HCB185ZH]|uniref:HRDC domain-containing protein n=1 Tax=Bdellovibrio sp. HCB185ZH TaxID=3394235 RepID=UPI0039A57D90
MDRHQHELVHAWLDWKKKKTGRYPSFKEQKKVLCERHNGILLGNYAGLETKTYSTPVRHTFIIEKSKAPPTGNSDQFFRRLFSDLRRERNRLAEQRNIPAYLVFKNLTLTQMAQQMPQDVESMKSIIGITPEKMRLYGEPFLAIIWKHTSEERQRKKS